MDCSMKPVEPDTADAPRASTPESTTTGLLKRARAFNNHSTAYLWSMHVGDALAIRGARDQAIIAALMLAASATSSERLFTNKVMRLAGFVAVLEEPLRSYVGDLLDGALAADAAKRIALGLAPPSRRFSDWMAPAIDIAAPPSAPSTLRVEHLAIYAAQVGTGDPDHVLLSAIATVRKMRAPSSERMPTEVGYDDLEYFALALCATAPASRPERDDARRVGLILWQALRHRRPLAAAILRTRMRMDRIRWGARAPCR